MTDSNTQFLERDNCLVKESFVPPVKEDEVLPTSQHTDNIYS